MIPIQYPLTLHYANSIIQPYYDALFDLADQNNTGSISGLQAVRFFAKSNLPLHELRDIWELADQNPTTNFLDRTKFYAAIRLIQLYQNEQKGRCSYNIPKAEVGENLKPAVFHGISGALVPLPPTPPQSGRAGDQNPLPTLATEDQDPYGMLPTEKERYEQIFPNYQAKNDGYVYGKEAVELFSKSGLSQMDLRDIWKIVDYDPIDNRLDKTEFAIAMHLIVCVSKRSMTVPTSLPPSLRVLKDSEVSSSLYQPPPSLQETASADLPSSYGVLSSDSSITQQRATQNSANVMNNNSDNGRNISEAFEFHDPDLIATLFEDPGSCFAFSSEATQNPDRANEDQNDGKKENYFSPQNCDKVNAKSHAGFFLNCEEKSNAYVPKIDEKNEEGAPIECHSNTGEFSQEISAQHELQSLVEVLKLENARLQKAESDAKVENLSTRSELLKLKVMCDELQQENKNLEKKIDDEYGENLRGKTLEEVEEIENRLKYNLDQVVAQKEALVKNRFDQEEEKRVCVICQVERKTVLLMPCRHLCICQECSRNDLDRCPLCRGIIDEKINVYS